MPRSARSHLDVSERSSHQHGAEARRDGPHLERDVFDVEGSEARLGLEIDSAAAARPSRSWTGTAMQRTPSSSSPSSTA